MIHVVARDICLEICPVTEDDLDQVLHVYQQCEDFLSLGPVATASMDMVLKDLELSEEEGGIFCGIYTTDKHMIGVVDYVAQNFHGNPHHAYLSLLMIDFSYRNQGIGQAVVEAVEHEVRKHGSVTTLLAGVQVNNPEAVQFWQRRGFQIVSGPKRMPDQTTVFDLRKDFQS